MKKIKFYLFGLIPGLLIMFFFLNQKGASCSGYLPNDRVWMETSSKKLVLSPDFKNALKLENLSDNFVKDSILVNSQIDFEKSHTHQKPCPDYIAHYPAKNPKFEVKFVKCDKEATFLTLIRIRK